MREIKFRAWHKRENKYLHKSEIVDSEKCPVIPDGNTFTLDDKGQMIFEQSTGLKDKNGTEIYEQDCCKVLFGEQELIYACEWYEEVGAWVFRGNGEWLMWEDVFETCEIIGNIHQYPGQINSIQF